MKINPIDKMSFKGNIIDAHAHTGKWYAKDYGADSLDVFIKEPLNITLNGVKQQDIVEKMLVSNLSCIDSNGLLDETVGNTKMLELCANNPKLYPLAVCQPNKTGGNASELKSLIDKNEGKFVGLKFHPHGLPLVASSAEYDDYLKLALKKKLPCLFHCQDNNSSPEAIYTLAKRHPKVPVIMAHLGAGGEANHKKAIDVLLESIQKGDAKLYADISWVDWGMDGFPSNKQNSIVDVIKKLKKENALDRLMFGTDAPLGCFGENGASNISPKQAYEQTVSNLKTVIKDNFTDDADDIINKIFHDNADELFFKKKWAEGLAQNLEEGITNPETVKKLSKGKIGAICAAGLLVIGTAALVLYNKFKGKPQNLPSPGAIIQNRNYTPQELPKPMATSQDYNSIFKNFTINPT